MGVEVPRVWQGVLAVQVHGASLPDRLCQVSQSHECSESSVIATFLS